MIGDWVVFLGLGLVDGAMSRWGIPISLLVFFPLYLFLNNHRLSRLLIGTFLAMFFTEVIRGYWPGTLLIPGGIAVMAIHFTVGTLNWSLLPVQWLGTAGYLVVLLGLRSVILIVMTGQGYFPSVFSWLLAYLLFGAFLLVRQLYTSASLPGDRLSR